MQTTKKKIPRKNNSPFCSACIPFMTLYYYLLSSFIKTYFFLLNFPNDIYIYIRRTLISCESFHLSFLYFQPFWNVWALTRSVLNLQCPRRNLTTNLLLILTFWTLAKKKRKNTEMSSAGKKIIEYSLTFLLFKEKNVFFHPTISHPKNSSTNFFSLFLKNGKNAN